MNRQALLQEKLNGIEQVDAFNGSTWKGGELVVLGGEIPILSLKDTFWSDGGDMTV